MYLIAIVLILLNLCAQICQTSVQAKPAQTCPVITVSCPDKVDQHETMACSASVSGGPNSRNISFRWMVSKGKITKGQQTASIEVDTKDLFPADVKVTAEVMGEWPYSCARQATAVTVLVISDPGPKLLDEYGDIPFEKERLYLHRLALLLEEEAGSQPYIIAYAGRRAYPNEAAKRGEKAKTFLVENYGIEAARVVVLDGGHRETRIVELWLVPPGAPSPSPAPTIDAKDVQMLKRKRPDRNN